MLQLGVSPSCYRSCEGAVSDADLEGASACRPVGEVRDYSGGSEWGCVFCNVNDHVFHVATDLYGTLLPVCCTRALLCLGLLCGRLLAMCLSKPRVSNERRPVERGRRHDGDVPFSPCVQVREKALRVSAYGSMCKRVLSSVTLFYLSTLVLHLHVYMSL